MDVNLVQTSCSEFIINIKHSSFVDTIKLQDTEFIPPKLNLLCAVGISCDIY